MEEFKVPSSPGSAPKAEKKVTTPNEQEDSVAETPKQNLQESLDEPPPPEKNQACPYKTPNWSAPPSDRNVNYKFEVLKSGQIIEEIDNLQKQANWTFGRLIENDVVLAHPTISRFHAVLQYRPHPENTDESLNDENNSPPEGWYLFDLGSTHGTFLNKQRIPPKVFIRIRVGHMLKLGASTRSYILQGPMEDEEPESEFSVTELREQRDRKITEAAEAMRVAEEEERHPQESEGISWGLSEDANEESDLSHNPYASTTNEDYYAANPKQALRHFFEREDMPLEYRCDEMSLGSFVCRIDLPVDDENGRTITAEVVHKGKKKDCAFQCALEACRILDRLGVLRQKNQEPLARRKKLESDSDEDDFLDRTGDIARKKERKANANTSVTLTYDDLLKQEKDLMDELEKVETCIAEYQAKQKRLKQQAEAQNEADLDSFMENLNEDDSKLDKTEIKKLRLDQQRLKSEQQRLKRLIKIAKPYDLPFPKSNVTGDANSAGTSTAKKQLPMIGKRNQFSKFKVIKPASNAPSTTTSKTYASDEEEMDDEDKPEDMKDAGKEIQKTFDETKSKESDKKASKVLTEDVEQVKECENDKASTKTEETVEKCSHNEEDITDEDLISSTSKISRSETLPAATSSAICEAEKSPPQNLNEDNSGNAENSRKRVRQRPRVRGKRQDVDDEELDEHESSEKYAKWVPPANQTGDGFTALNEKFGY